jgi:signal transduction histidine kinase
LQSGVDAIAPGGQHGILGMRERVSALDGVAWIGSHEGAFIVDVTLPWQERGESSLSSTGDPR